MIRNQAIWQKAIQNIKHSPRVNRRIRKNKVDAATAMEALESRVLLAGVNSDDFNALALDPQWTFTDPIGDASVNVDGKSLRINLPGGNSNHSVSGSGINRQARVTQDIANTDFEMEVRFDVTPEGRFAQEGIMVEDATTGDTILFELRSESSGRLVRARVISGGSVSVKATTAILAEGSFYMRVQRQGDTWTQSYSTDGVNYAVANTFDQVLSSDRAGVYAGNKGAPFAPEFTSVVDYVFDTANPISPEDSNPAIDITAPIVSRVNVEAESTTINVDWITDDNVLGTVRYGKTPALELGTVSETIAGEIHFLQIPNLDPFTTYYVEVVSDNVDNSLTTIDSNHLVRTGDVADSQSRPVVDIWYGNTQDFGTIGNPQRWVNILGNVSDPDGVSSVVYELNPGSGNAPVVMTVGPNNDRLINDGDINIDIDQADLIVGSNIVQITAVDTQGNTRIKLVTVNYDGSNTWPEDYIADWSSGAINEVAQVVDGLWLNTPKGVRTVNPGFDRLINLGDINATDYEVTVPITIHHLEYDQPGVFPAAGLLVNWQGHQDTDNFQPHTTWWPLGAIGWSKVGGLGLVGNATQNIGGTGTFARDIQLETTYLYKMKVESNVGAPSTYSFKVWEEGTAEPTEWDAVGEGLADENSSGSINLLAHYTDATFGDVIICSDGLCDIGPVGDDDPAPNEVVENGAIDTPVGITALATDSDATDTVTYSLDDNAGNRFKIDATTGVVTTRRVLDFELSQSHTIVVRATSSDGSSSVGSMVIDVVNESDTFPERFLVVDFNNANDVPPQLFEYDQNLDPDGTTSLAAANLHPRGISSSFDFQEYWVLNSDDKVFAYDADFNVQGSWLATGLLNAQGITTNGEDVWITDIQNQTLHFFEDGAQLLTGAAAATTIYDLHPDNNHPYGITTDGNFLWVLNSGTARQVYKYELDGTYLGRFGLTENINGRGIAIDPGSPDNLWVVDTNNQRILQYNDSANLLTGVRTADVTYDTAPGNVSPQGIVTFRTTTGPLQEVTDRDATPNEVYENQIIGTPVGTTAYAKDPDITDVVTYSLTDDAGGKFQIDSETGVISTAAVLDINDGTSYTVTVQAVSSDTTQQTADFTIAVLDSANTDKFYVADQNEEDTFQYDEFFGLEDRISLPGNPRGITANAAGTTWVIEGNGDVTSYDRTGALLDTWRALGLSRIEGVATDGTHIWVLDSGATGADKIFFFANGASLGGGSTVSPTSSFNLTGGAGEAWGITTDGTNVWIVDTDPGQSANQVFRYNVDGTFEGKWAIDPANSLPRGITIDPANPTDIWIVDRFQDRVYQYDGGASLLTGGQNASLSFVLQNRNDTAQGIAKSGIGLNAPPKVTIDTLLTNDTTPEITGTVNDPTATVSVTVNGETYLATNNQDGTWAVVDGTIVNPLTDGTYDVSVIATDLQNNSAADSTTDELTIDLVAPAIAVNALQTQSTSPALSGTVDDPAASVAVTVDGATYNALNIGDGTWLIPAGLISTLAEGTYDVTAEATDPAGNVTTDGTSAELQVDLTAPVVTIDFLTTTDSTPELTGTVDDNTATVFVTLGGNTLTATNNQDGTWTLADNVISQILADGTYDVVLTASDPVNNTSNDTTSNELVIDAPPIIGVDPLITSDQTPALTGTVNDPQATVSVEVNGSTYAAVNNQDGTWSLADDTISPALAEGVYSVTATGTDIGNNSDTDITSNELEIDLTAPTSTVDTLLSSDPTPQLSGLIDDPLATLTVTIDGNTYPANNVGNGRWVLSNNTISPALAVGVYDVVVNATDPYGNAGVDSTTNEVTIDIAPIPTIDVLETTDTTPELTGLVDDPDATLVVRILGINADYNAINNGDGTWVLPDNTLVALAEGTYNVRVTATDLGGNVGLDQSTGELTVDLTAPTVTVDVLITPDSSPELTGDVDDPNAAVLITVGGGNYVAVNNGDGTWSLPDNLISPPLGDGFYNVVATAIDVAGNTGNDASFAELGITAAPVITVDEQLTTDTTPGISGTIDDPTAIITVEIAGATYSAINNGDGTWNIPDNTLPPLPDGTYDIAVFGLDQAGSTGTDPTQDELIVDTTAPVSTVDILITADSTPELTGTVDDPDARITVTLNGNSYNAINNGDGTWLLPDNTISPPLSDGAYNVLLLTVDPAENTATDSTIAELAVFAPPVVTVDFLLTNDPSPALTGTIDDPGATVTVTVNGATYNAINNTNGTWTLPNNVITPGLDNGTYTVEASATDLAGLVSGPDGTENELTVISSGLYRVNSVGDAGDINPGDGICDTGNIVNGQPECTLRAAIEEANAGFFPGSNLIDFDFVGSSDFIISLTAPLPEISGDIEIDGTSAGYTGTPNIGIDGSNVAGTGVNGLTITGDGILVKGLAIYGFSGDGIEIDGGTNTQLIGNHIGIDLSGQADGNFYGVEVLGGSGNSIGMVGEDANVISGNAKSGVFLVDSDQNTVVNNYIGTDVTGTTAIKNFGNGVHVLRSTDSTITNNLISGNNRLGITVGGTVATGTNIIGNYIGTTFDGQNALGNGIHGIWYRRGTGVISNNLVSGNGQNGITVSGGFTNNNVVEDNIVGTDIDGDTDLGNGDHGIVVYRGDSTIVRGNLISGQGKRGILVSGQATNTLIEDNTIGTDVSQTIGIPNELVGVQIQDGSSLTTLADNLIAGNLGTAVLITNAGSNDNTLVRNTIGMNSLGNPLPNGGNGVEIRTSGNTVGGSAADANVLASGNRGVLLSGSDTFGNEISYNFIGTDSAETQTNLGNTIGILINGGAHDNMVASNVIAQNSREGIRANTAGTGNTFSQNSIHDNGTLGIDLDAATGATLNDVDDADTGVNNLQNYPTISNAVVNSGQLMFEFLVDTAVANATYPLTVEFFEADANGQGTSFLGSATYTAAQAQTTASVIFNASISGNIVATATDADGNTSEFSPEVGVGGGGGGASATGTDYNVDVDGNGTIQPLTDGVTIIRYLAGFTGDALTQGTVDADGTRSSAAEIESHLQTLSFSLDADGDGHVQPLSDGIVLLRYMAGFRGDVLTADAVNTPTVDDTEAITARLDSLMRSATFTFAADESVTSETDVETQIDTTPDATDSVAAVDSSPDAPTSTISLPAVTASVPELGADAETLDELFGDILDLSLNQ